LSQRSPRTAPLRRQKQYIGKLDARRRPAPIQAQLDVFNGVSVAENAKLHQAEKWRDKLIADNEALTLFLNAHPDADATPFAAADPQMRATRPRTTNRRKRSARYSG